MKTSQICLLMAAMFVTGASDRTTLRVLSVVMAILATWMAVVGG